jgi:hypothetical protein
MFSQRNLQGEGNLHSGTEVRVIRLGSKVAALPNTAKRFSPNALIAEVRTSPNLSDFPTNRELEHRHAGIFMLFMRTVNG